MNDCENVKYLDSIHASKMPSGEIYITYVRVDPDGQIWHARPLTKKEDVGRMLETITMFREVPPPCEVMGGDIDLPGGYVLIRNPPMHMFHSDLDVLMHNRSDGLISTAIARNRRGAVVYNEDPFQTAQEAIDWMLSVLFPEE